MPAKVYAAVPTPMYLFPFNGDFIDHSGNDKPVVVGTGASIVTDPVRGKVLNLIGGTNISYISVTNSLPPSYTKSAWVKLGVANYTQNYGILSNGTTL